MKKALFTIALCAFIAGPAMADMYVKVEAGLYQTGAGGEFKATLLEKVSKNWGGKTTWYYSDPVPGYPGVGESWQTFCMEYNEHISLGTTYEGDLNIKAVTGGAGGDGSGDPIDPMTAYLYTQFSKGTLSGYFDNPSGRKNSADQLQKVIWYIEGEWNYGKTPTQAFGTTGLDRQWYNEAVEATTLGQDGMITWSGLGDVRVLNLYGWNSTTHEWENLAQDILIVPAPAAILLGFLGLGAAGLKLRRFA